MTIEAFAPAKVNLALHVTGQRDDGYHVLDSLVVFADVGDRLSLTPGAALSLEVTGPFAAGVPADPRNLVWRAAELSGWAGHIHLEKHLPHGGGIGGGSADAAAVLRALAFGGDATALGADVPVCVHSGAARMRGIGDWVDPVAHVPAMPALLVNPGHHLATPDVFRGLTRRDNPPLQALPNAQQPLDSWYDWLSLQRNDLEEPAQRIAPEVARVLRRLDTASDVRLVRMSGSGSTCFALFGTRNAAHLAQQQIALEHPAWWCQVVTLNPGMALVQ